MELVMERTVTKQVRLTKEEARTLKQLAATTGKTESELLRRGIAAFEREWARRDERQKAFDELMRMAEEVPGKNIPFRLK
jgi:predicted transcriptional regulator